MDESDFPEGWSEYSGFPRGDISRVQAVNIVIGIDFPEGWFETIGFPLGNPFQEKQPDTDDELEACFQDKIYFKEVAGKASQPRTTILSGQRGCGKSANRKMLERYCHRGSLGGTVLPVPYTDFSRFLDDQPHSALEPHTRNHVKQILGKAVIALFNLLVDRPDLARNLYSSGHMSLLKYYVKHHTTLLTTAGMDSWLSDVGLLSRAVNFGTILEPVRDASALDWSRRMPKGAAVIEILVGLQRVAPMPPTLADHPDQIPYVHLLESFVNLVTFLGVKAVYILIDRIDEVPELAGDPVRQATILEPLLSSLPLMELPKTAFKFFIPTDVAEVLRQRQRVRTDRLAFRIITWSIPDLVELLERRLDVYSKHAFTDLSQFCTPGMEDIMADIARHAHGSPRNMLRIGERLIYEAMLRRPHSATPAVAINQEDFRRALESFGTELQLDTLVRKGRPPGAAAASSEPQPALYVDQAGKVWRYGVQLPVALSDSEYKLLRFLCQNPGKLLEHQQLVAAVYGPTKRLETDLSAFYAVVRRLRRKVEPVPQQPVFIITVRAIGYRFEPQGSRD